MPERRRVVVTGAAGLIASLVLPAFRDRYDLTLLDVCTSSNHAADYYERLILDHKHDFVYPETKPLSDNFYGWAK